MRHYGKFAASLITAAALVAPAAPAAIISEGPGLGVSDDWAGVGKLGSATLGFYGTASLIGPRYVLTAAHLVEGLGNTAARFEVNGVTYNSTAIAIHPQYVGNDDFDIAVITLASDVANVPIYRYNAGDLDELTAGPGVKVGFGLGGSGATGVNGVLFPYGVKRAGSNAIDVVTTSTIQVIDGLGNTMDVPAGMLLYDFDNPLLGGAGPLGGAAVGPNEVDTTAGDSGGPMFQYSAARDQWVITGITIGGSDDASRFGDIASDLRVATYAPWIDSQVPEPGAIAIVLLSLPFVARRARRN